jgi:predicted metal-dependent enzyme (double-stranded beta helix superfamily)
MYKTRTRTELRRLAELLACDLETRVLATQMIQFYSTEEKRMLTSEENLTAMLLKWQPGEQTQFHSHGKSIGVFRVLAGTICEETLEDYYVAAKDFDSTETSTFATGAVHRLTCISRVPAISLHIYANAPGGLDEITEYQTDPNGNLLLPGGKPVIARIRKMG